MIYSGPNDPNIVCDFFLALAVVGLMLGAWFGG